MRLAANKVQLDLLDIWTLRRDPVRTLTHGFLKREHFETVGTVSRSRRAIHGPVTGIVVGRAKARVGSQWGPIDLA